MFFTAMSHISQTFALLLLAATAYGQSPAAPAEPSENRPPLKALPIGGDDDPDSAPLPAGSPPKALPVDEPANPPAASVQTSAPAQVSPSPSAVDGPQLASNRTAGDLSSYPGAARQVIPAKPVTTPVAKTKPTGEDALRLQIFLDQQAFGPGIIDGKPGRFTELAVQAWNETKGHPTGDWTAVNTAARHAVPNPLAIATVPEFSLKWVDPELSATRTLQAKAKRMSYRSVAEFMAERYHCDIPYLAELNGWKKIQSLKPHDAITVPNVAPFLIELLSEIRHPSEPVMSLRHVVVDTKTNQARIYEASPAALAVDESAPASPTPAKPNQALIASFPITPGQPKFIKFGTWELRNMVELPYWRYDQQLLDTGKRSQNALNIPPGPNSPVGVIWNGLSKPGIGLHGTSDPETIGRARSSGCIRLANWDAIRLPTLIRPGATVEIR